MRKIITLAFIAAPLAFGSAEQLIPTADGTSWQYQMTQEAGEGLRLSSPTPDADGKVQLLVLYRIDGATNIDGKDLLKFEMHRDGVVTNTDLLTVNEHGIICSARIDQDGETTKLDPPQIMVAATLQTGTSWDFNGEVAGTKVHQHYDVIGEEDVTVPAGKFRAFQIHGEQTSPNPVTIDRWFVKGLGIVKDVTTTRSEDGDLLRRISLELKERPKVAARPMVKSSASTKLTVTVSKETTGPGTAQFGPDTEKIYARWGGHDLRPEAKIRVVWIAENIGDIAPPDYTIDEASTVASASYAHGTFTLSRPDEGWVPGDYRVEFYLDDALVQAVKLKIAK
jgi:hypothetical protein